ncbi:hypothetical protein COT75_01895 [Candidatus Beckwithbacteria bacterium CG10_big_fil_rev_8_21_14_0_10_34_10]|uniref:Glycosyltransferase RgtA/B/C/D-like domain-containing protein n=1 Tax=Candidatus Beckwithbacteria bacterium CG10_big_fil_rev_8_21_14_0_10_34_10 TaxID=1974495 RepID=A0A2H0W9S5_9BACT|nr:MAG: hypothetical protein COT75_01895 [Candidatus Beckwithbacteria bacterium CG10_big_fil_rev_8_21_14_0_10_34_10]
MIIFILIILYLISRLINLTALPVFADEAIYIRWAQLIFDNWERAFIPMMDGKPPLFMWLIMEILRIVKDPLMAGRLLSVILGLLTLVFIYLLTKNFFNKKTALLATFFYLTSPFFFIYNRMALIEGLLAFTLCLQIYFLSLYFKTKKKYFILLSGLSWGLSMLSKTSAFFFFPLYLPLGFYLSKEIDLSKKNKFIKKRWWRLRIYFSNLLKNKEILFYIFFAGVLGCLFFLSITRRSHFFPALFRRSRDFSFTIEEFLQGQYKSVGERLLMVLKWLFYYNSPLVFASFLGSFYFLFKNKNKREKKVIFLFWFFIMIFLLPLVFMGKILSPRYFLPLSPLVLILASLVITRIKSKTGHSNWFKRIRVLIISSTLGFNLYFIGLSLLDADKTPFLQVDKTYYLQEWSSGHGIKEAFDYLNKIAEKENIFVAAEGYFGTLPDGFVIYKDAYGITSMEVEGIGPYVKSVSDLLKEKAKEKRTFILGNSHRFIFSQEEPLNLLKTYYRPAGGPQLLLYEVLNVEKD